jgi:hypothetical protein
MSDPPPSKLSKPTAVVFGGKWLLVLGGAEGRGPNLLVGTLDAITGRIVGWRADPAESFAFDRRSPAATAYGDKLYLWGGDFNGSASSSVLQIARIDGDGRLLRWR